MNPASPLDLHDAILENSLAAPRDDKGLAFCRRNRHVAIQFALDVVLPFLKVGVRGRHAPIGLLAFCWTATASGPIRAITASANRSGEAVRTADDRLRSA